MSEMYYVLVTYQGIVTYNSRWFVYRSEAMDYARKFTGAEKAVVLERIDDE